MISDKSRVTLTIDGSIFDGWLSVKISQSIEQLAGTFSLTIANMPHAWRIKAGSACEVKIGTDLVITGYVDSKAVKHDARSTAINVQGRDKTGDLVDSSAMAREWQGLSFEEVVKQLIAPHKIELFTQLETGQNGYKPKKVGKGKAPVAKAGAGGGAIAKKATNTGDTVHKVLEKLCKAQACLLVSDGRGGLVVTRAGLNGRAHDALVVGENILSIEVSENFANLFSEITIKGQASGAQNARLNLANVTEQPQRVKAAGKVEAKTTVKGAIGRYRPLIMQAEEQADPARCKRRAEWEAGNREAKAKKIVIKVQGWRQTNGALWAINTLASVVSDYTDNGSEWLITNISFDLSNAGTITELTLYSPLAYDVLPDIPEKTNNGTGKRLSLATVQPR